eukprot:s1250_g28.t1
MTEFATLNVGRGGVAKTTAHLAAFGETVPEVIALQDLDINNASIVRYVQNWRRRGFRLRRGATRCGSNLAANDSVVFAIAEFVSGGVIQKILLGSIYADVRDSNLAAALVQRSARAANSYGLPWLLLGDYNLEQDQSCFANSSLRHQVSVADHYAVIYGLANLVDLQCHKGPRRH